MNPTFLKDRAEKIGSSITEARISNGQAIEDLSENSGISVTVLEAYEIGEQSPSLPELELIAYQLRTPLEYFVDGDDTLLDKVKPLDPVRFLGIRQRIIGAQLRQARIDADITLEEVSKKTGIEIGVLHSYEMGMIPIPIPQLESLVPYIQASIRDFSDKHGQIGEWLTKQQQIKLFLGLPDELREFLLKPVNKPYLELAMRLSEMSVDKLRAVAEGLLEITL